MLSFSPIIYIFENPLLPQSTPAAAQRRLRVRQFTAHESNTKKNTRLLVRACIEDPALAFCCTKINTYNGWKSSQGVLNRKERNWKES
jgi:hypothetical protein